MSGCRVSLDTVQSNVIAWITCKKTTQFYYSGVLLILLLSSFVLLPPHVGPLHKGLGWRPRNYFFDPYEIIFTLSPQSALTFHAKPVAAVPGPSWESPSRDDARTHIPNPIGHHRNVSKLWCFSKIYDEVWRLIICDRRSFFTMHLRFFFPPCGVTPWEV